MSDEGSQANRLESLLLNFIFAGISLGLLVFLKIATHVGVASGGWWTRPAFIPGVALGILVIANFLTLERALRDLKTTPATPAEWDEAREKLRQILTPMEFLAYFAAYLFGVIHLGYFPATLIFVPALMWRVGLRSRGWIGAGLGLVIALTLIFRIGLGIWMPTPDYYDAAPEILRPYLTSWF